MALPITPFKDQIIQCVTKNQVTLIVASTGSGKSTQIPQFLFHSGLLKNGLMAITEPRRIAAITLAQRVSQELRQPNVGGLVGYAIRFKDVTSKSTRIKFMTDGLLVRESLFDSNFSNYNIIIIDEAHERSLRSDILLGLLKLRLKHRPDLKIVIMSATLQYEKFLQFFKPSEILMIPGKQFPVEIFYTAIPEQDYLEAAMLSILQIHLSRSPGDILVFLPGQEDIESLCSILKQKSETLTEFLKFYKLNNNSDSAQNGFDHSKKENFSIQIGQRVFFEMNRYTPIMVLPLYASLSSEEQAYVFMKTPDKLRKVIVATNIAETSITIPGIKYVVDCGLAKYNNFNPKTGIEELKIKEISKSSANQRSGRAGRESPGQAFRLYTQDSFSNLEVHTPPEIARSNLAQVYLELKVSGINDPTNFPFIDPPETLQLTEAGRTLTRIKAIDPQGNVTDLGKKIVSLPLDPILAATLIHSIKFECTYEILIIVAMLSVDSIFYTPRNLTASQEQIFVNNRKRLAHPDGDHLTLLNTFLLWNESNDKIEFCKANGINFNVMQSVDNIRDQLRLLIASHSFGVKIVSQCPDMNHWFKIRQCLTFGGFLFTARLVPGKREYMTEISRQTVYIHPKSVLFGLKNLPSSVVYSKFIRTSKLYIKEISIAEDSWVQEALLTK